MRGEEKVENGTFLPDELGSKGWGWEIKSFANFFPVVVDSESPIVSAGLCATVNFPYYNYIR